MLPPAAPVALQTGTGTPPWVTSPPRVSCPKPLRAELDRLLAAASAHASESSGCIDGPGEKTTLTLLRVDAAPSKGVRWVRIRYGAMSEEERGAAECSGGSACAPPAPWWGIGEISIRFAPAGGGYEMTVPEKWPGIALQFSRMTPLDREHDGKCYGKSPPFSPAVVKGW